MGVRGLWDILEATAHPVKLEALAKKKLAVDASIWIYHFLKAVRDKEGHALKSSHVVGFFRRICKLLYFGIQPVFVFDGGAPILKRQTIARRKQNRAERKLNKNNNKPLATAEEYEKELRELREQHKKDVRDADEVNAIMILECQELLRAFGIPYVVAPMEAEAQCAELLRLGLVEGVVTDDSDAFLFGATKVYKNMFSQSKFVECYYAADIERNLGLDQKKLIALAHVLGSDYAEGLPGVGPVIATELLAEFYSEDE
ncbi:hypothetical protein CANCADRAFT_19392, partial [Tortispora caseinolytica NRRL Y-17796]